MIYHSFRQRASTSFVETEALQTDIMRFLAIICMCLLIVFALVQSLPVSDTANRPQITTAELLEKRIQSLKQKIEQLQQQRALLDEGILSSRKKLQKERQELAARRLAKGELENLIQEKMEQIRQKEKHLNEVAASTKHILQKGNRLWKAIEKAERELAAKHANLEITKARITDGEKELEKLESELLRAQTELRQPVATKSQQYQANQKSLEPKDTHGKNNAAKEQEGFTLDFASDEALIRLLKRDNGISLFLIAGTKHFKLTVNQAGAMIFLPASPPEQIFVMDIRTVPEKILTAGKSSVAAFGRGTVTYGVTLPSTITGQLSKLMASRKGGNMVISADASVTIE